jgi:hypothetical protein
LHQVLGIAAGMHAARLSDLEPNTCQACFAIGAPTSGRTSSWPRWGQLSIKYSTNSCASLRLIRHGHRRSRSDFSLSCQATHCCAKPTLMCCTDRDRRTRPHCASLCKMSPNLFLARVPQGNATTIQPSPDPWGQRLLFREDISVHRPSATYKHRRWLLPVNSPRESRTRCWSSRRLLCKMRLPYRDFELSVECRISFPNVRSHGAKPSA